MSMIQMDSVKHDKDEPEPVMRPARIPKPSGCPRWARDRSSPAC